MVAPRLSSSLSTSEPTLPVLPVTSIVMSYLSMFSWFVSGRMFRDAARSVHMASAIDIDDLAREEVRFRRGKEKDRSDNEA